MASDLPGYVRSSTPVPRAKRAAWYRNTFPAYAGIFLWVGFYAQMAGTTLDRAGVGLCLAGLLVAGFLCFALYYYAPAMLGMQTGRPLYVVGTAMFGTAGGYLMPGLLMGVLQLGWFAVATSISTQFIMRGLHQESKLWFTVIGLLWAYGLALVALKGIGYVARVAEVLNWVPMIMIAIVFWKNLGGVAAYRPPQHDPWGGFATIIDIVIGFFATAGAAGADFGMNNRHRQDVALGGFFGIALSILLAGGLTLLSVAGHIATTSGPANYDYSGTIASVGSLAPVMFFLFAAASVAPTCFCTLIASNSFATMLPKIPRSVSTLAGVTVGAILAVTGVAQNLIGFFVIVGASFGPVCGAIAADYLLAGRKWSGPRLGINWAGYASWAAGFVVGVLNHIPGVPAELLKLDRPAALCSFIVAFIVYYGIATAGLVPPAIALEASPEKMA
jgi:purine-cytosine permease-like protein